MGLIVTSAPVVAATADSSLGSQFDTLHGATVRPAKGTPKPSSGTEVVLWSAGSYASAVVSGAGRVTVSVRGSACPGVIPTISVSSDGTELGTQEVTGQAEYQNLVFGSPLPSASHVIRVTMTNGAYIPSVCDVNAYVAGVSLAGVQSSAPPSTAKPGPSNTGVPAGTSLTVHQGDLTVTKDGTVIDALDIHGGLYIKANNVTITRTLVRGGPASANSLALVAAWWGFKGIKISDSTLKADTFSLTIDGLSGSNITASRLNISNVVDTVKVIGPNFTLQDSWLHDNFHSENDPHQSSGATHDDNVQVEGGDNILIQHNTLANAHNAAVMVTQNNRVTSNLHIRNNWISGGACSINMTQRAKGGPILGTSISGNRFSGGTYGNTCPMLIPATSPVSITDNVWDATDAPAVARRF